MHVEAVKSMLFFSAILKSLSTRLSYRCQLFSINILQQQLPDNQPLHFSPMSVVMPVLAERLYLCVLPKCSSQNYEHCSSVPRSRSTLIMKAKVRNVLVVNYNCFNVSLALQLDIIITMCNNFPNNRCGLVGIHNEYGTRLWG